MTVDITKSQTGYETRSNTTISGNLRSLRFPTPGEYFPNTTTRTVFTKNRDKKGETDRTQHRNSVTPMLNQVA